MKVKDCMCKQVCFCKPDTKIGEIARMMNENHIGSVPICDEKNTVVGIVTDRDIILRAVACNKDNNTAVSEIMTCGTTCCDCNKEVSEASRLMKEEQIRRIPVTENGKLVGILTLGDLAKNQQINNEFVGHTTECICGCDDKNAE